MLNIEGQDVLDGVDFEGDARVIVHLVELPVEPAAKSMSTMAWGCNTEVFINCTWVRPALKHTEQARCFRIPFKSDGMVDSFHVEFTSRLRIRQHGVGSTC